MGREAFIAEVEKEYGSPLRRAAGAEVAPRPMADKHGHIGVYDQKQAGLNYLGLVLPVGRLTSEQMRGLAEIAERFGSGTLRFTVWQNLLISDVADRNIGVCIAAINALGLAVEASAIRRGLVACTGNAGCKFSASNTKGHALRLADYDQIRQGELVFAFESPEGLLNSVTMGVVSSIARQPDPEPCAGDDHACQAQCHG